jgi:Asp-tRNA(Asn)/Glu-tRNA(Gln) amidotransferase C subunit
MQKIIAISLYFDRMIAFMISIYSMTHTFLRDEEILHLAHLSGLSIESENLPVMRDELSCIIDFVGKLSVLDCSDVEAPSHLQWSVFAVTSDPLVSWNTHCLLANAPRYLSDDWWPARHIPLHVDLIQE